MKTTDNILEEDGVMADKGFKIDKDINKLGLRLNISPIAPASWQMKTSDVNMTESCYLSSSCRELHVYIEARFLKNENFR